MRKITLLRGLLLIVSVACLTLYSYTFLERIGSQAYAAWAFDRDAQRLSSLQAKAAPSEPLVRDAVVGRISVPRLHLSVMVREGVAAKTLRRAVGHIPETPLPGQPGNVGLAGHRDTFFRHLGDLKPGDRIAFSTSAGDFSYAVESSTVVAPEDVGVLASSSENVLTMVTCYPFFYIGNAPKRFVVRAREIAGAER